MSPREAELLSQSPRHLLQLKPTQTQQAVLLFQSLELLGNEVLHLLDVHASPALQGSHPRLPLLALRCEKPLPTLSSH